MAKQVERTRGAKPACPEERESRVAAAVRALERIGAAFTVADVAERAGISRATIYRDHALRALVGAKGDGLRPVDPAVHAKLCTRHETLKTRARDLRRTLADMEKNWDEMRERALRAEQQLAEAQRHIQSLRAQARSDPAGGAASMRTIAARLGPEGVRQARRQLARALHPDLFEQNSPAAALATELLKTLNALAE